mmetsp:Transcript_24202/g.64839  ORF Transcript_24202/g.64839 Transcript_24202/m.64839 type:complete len:361 (+) Transcript_24202:14-1096(+)|eukprot:CAMPEP_0113664452 /NCGR_PEP_ID=MMETSP0038_2-20120614/1743_1 /TAXON_ID=2898 /ORGANISM="Cryptomonas paramecium" /LENGTH=360 /DNA_ID=CAMNT_0000579667 /DNA_START=14 /DNA_END=1096 /DNA_ORIENTATION=- /assembly_acc=CAM_ASM_000170
MAKFEEADPRWKVKDLGEQGRNVNNWHWTENDCFPWFKEEFGKIFDDAVILIGPTSGGQTGEVKCTKVDKCTGEASFSRRKGNKSMLLYEIELNLKWESTIKNAAGEVVSTSKGAYNMPCIDTVEAIDGFEIQVKFNKDKAENLQANNFAKAKGSEALRSMIVAAIERFKAQTASAPSSQADAPSTSSSSASTQVLTAALKAAAVESSHTTKATKDGSTGTINVSTEYNAPVKEIFECFAITQRLMAFTQSRAQVGTKPGDPFSLFDGSISGTVVDFVPEQKIVWKWRQSSWAEGVFSTCTLTFSDNGPGSTRLSVHQTGIPNSDAHGNDDMVRVVEEGWKRNLLDRIKMVFGYGSPEFQ